MIEIDGSYGEGGGQILRTAITLSTSSGLPVRLINIRSGRPVPGLAAQHLTVVQAATEICEADVTGAVIGSETLEFFPRKRPKPGRYAFDIGLAKPGGSAGAAMLLLQATLFPLALSSGVSEVLIRGGTHVRFSPTFENISGVWQPELGALGLSFALRLIRAGWYANGRGEVLAKISGNKGETLKPVTLQQRGPLVELTVKALGSRIREDLLTSMASTVQRMLAAKGIRAKTQTALLPAANAGSGIFIIAQYRNARAGFEALGSSETISETVARRAIDDFIAFHSIGRAVEEHLADQLLIPAIFAGLPSQYNVQKITPHLQTNAWVIGKFGLGKVLVIGSPGKPGTVKVSPARSLRNAA